MSKYTFVSQFFRHPLQVSTFMRIQPSLAKPMARNVEGKVIAEFGSGLGDLTKYIIPSLQEDGRLYCLEINPKFCEELKKIEEKDKRVQVINAPAQEMYSHVKEKVDCVVCSVPFAFMNRETKESIIEVAAKSELFVPMQCWLPTLTGLFEKYFDSVSYKLVPNHLPPSWYYVCRKPSKTS